MLHSPPSPATTRSKWCRGLPGAALLVAAVVILTASCADPDEQEPAPRLHDERTALVDNHLWEPSEDDPHPDHRPVTIDCPEPARIVEDNALEVNTDACNYLSLSQPAQTWITKGEPLRIVMWTQQLFNVTPAQGHVALSIGGEVVWEELVDIPAGAQTWTPVLESPLSAEEGTPIHLHLHNHGANTWYFLSFAVGE